MFGRKGLAAQPTPQPLRYAADPRPAHRGPHGAVDKGADDAIAALSEAFGIDLDFGTAFIFAPSLWAIPVVGDMLTVAGIGPRMRGNTIQLLRSPASVAKLAAMPPDAPLRQVLLETGFGIGLYDPDVENGYSAALAAMQTETLKGFAAKYSAPDPRRYAVFDFHKWSGDVMAGRIKL